MRLTLRRMPAIAPRGKNMGVFTNVELKTEKDASGKDRQVLKVVVDLDAKDAQGRAYQLDKDYNLSGHGLRYFQDDFAACFGRRLTDQELDDFDVDALIMGKRVAVETDHRKEGKKWVPIIQQLLPAETAEVNK